MDDLMWFLFGCITACALIGCGVILYVKHLEREG